MLKNMIFVLALGLASYSFGDSFLLDGTYASGASKPQDSTVRICAVAEGRVQKCGSGVIINHHSILTAWHVVSPVQLGELAQTHWVMPDIMILRENSTKFEEAVLDYPVPGLDIAVLRVKKLSTSVILHDTFFRGEKVWAVGNPGGKDFVVVETTITGVELMPGPSGLIELIKVDDKEHRIRSGFSGGGLFTNWGVVGIVQMCSEEENACLAMPTRVLRSQLK